MKDARILYLSTLFPNSVDTGLSPFNRQQILALSQYAHVDVVAPVAWPRALKNPVRLKSHTLGSVQVHHPLYLYVPKISTGPLREHPYALSVRSKIRKLTRERTFDSILASWLYPDAWVGAEWAERLGIPLYVKVHGTDVNRLSAGSSLTTRSLEVASRSRRVVCVSAALREELTALGVPQEKTIVVYNGVDTSIFHPRSRLEARAELNLPSSGKWILYVGNLKLEKGLGELASAVASLTDDETRLAIVGTGPYETGLRALLGERGIQERTLLTGALPLPHVAAWMSACDVLCLPSYAEGMPNVLLEGAACGAKMLATTVGGIPELAKVAGDLTLVPPRSAAALATALTSLLEAPPSEPNNRPRWASWDASARQLAEAIDLKPVSAVPGGGLYS